MKSFIVAAFAFGCVIALCNAAPTSSGENAKITAVYQPLFAGLEESTQNKDMDGVQSYMEQILSKSDDLLENVQGDTERQLIISVQEALQPALKKVKAGDSSIDDISNTVSGLATAAKEVLGWGAGTILGLGNAAATGVGQAIAGLENGLQNGLKDGNLIKSVANGLTGAVSGLVNGIDNGAASGFSGGLATLLG